MLLKAFLLIAVCSIQGSRTAPIVPSSLVTLIKYLINTDLPECGPELLLDKFVRIIGDMIYPLIDNDDEGAQPTNNSWPKGEIPFLVDRCIFSDTERMHTIVQAVDELNKYLCVNFRPWRKGDKHHVRIYDNILDPTSCSAVVGYQPGYNKNDYQEIFIAKECSRPYGKGNNIRTLRGTVMHELLHALGLFHEHSRDDRDSHVKIHWENIAESDKENFLKTNELNGGAVVTSYHGVPYNFQSIMQYAPTSRGTPTGTVTIEPLKGTGAIGNASQMGHECYLSQGDVDLINKKYSAEGNCFKPVPTLKLPPEICKLKTNSGPPTLLNKEKKTKAKKKKA